MDIHNLTQEEKAQQRKQHVRPDFPYSYSVSLGEFNCMHRCRMCPMFANPVEKEVRITDEIFTRSCQTVGDREVSMEISAFGETFQHPDAVRYINEARKTCPNAHIVVATNGALFDERLCEAIVDSGINHLSFSLDAGSAETHEWLTGAKNYDRICKGLETLVELKAKRNAAHMQITTHIMGITKLSHEFEGFLERWGDKVDYAYVRNLGNWAGQIDEGVTPSETQTTPEERYPCAWPWYATKIEPTGDVAKCFIHRLSDPMIGNIMEEDLEAIWTGKRMEELRQKLMHNDLEDVPHCENCTCWSLFPNFWDKATTDDGKTVWE